MMRGLQIAASGMRAEQARLDTVAANLAGSAVPGFQRQTAVVASFPDALLAQVSGHGAGALATLSAQPRLLGPLGHGSFVDEVGGRSVVGPVQQTGNPLHIALDEGVYMATLTAQGIAYTRRGDLQQDAEGRLVDYAGNPVLVGGAVAGEPGASLTIEKDGMVRVGETAVGQIDLYRLTEPVQAAVPADRTAVSQGGYSIGAPRSLGGLSSRTLQQVAGGPLPGAPPAAALAPIPPGQVNVRIGALEAANVEPVREMVEMIAAMRAYEANYKAIQVQDEMLGKAVNEVGRI